MKLQSWRVTTILKLPKGSEDPNNRELGAQNHSEHSFGALNPHHFSIWTLRVTNPKPRTFIYQECIGRPYVLPRARDCNAEGCVVTQLEILDLEDGLHRGIIYRGYKIG